MLIEKFSHLDKQNLKKLGPPAFSMKFHEYYNFPQAIICCFDLIQSSVAPMV